MKLLDHATIQDVVGYLSLGLSIASIIVSIFNRMKIDDTRKELLFKSTASAMVEYLQSFATFISSAYSEFPDNRNEILHRIRLYDDELGRFSKIMPLSSKKLATKMRKQQAQFMKNYKSLGPNEKDDLWRLFYSDVSVLAEHLNGTLRGYVVGARYEK
jgi:hypothetical protein